MITITRSASTRLAAALAVTTLALAACGGSDDDASSDADGSDRDTIVAAVVVGFGDDEVDAECIDEGVAAFSDADAALLAEAIADGGDDGDLPGGLSADAAAQIETVEDCLDFDVIVAHALADYASDDDREVIFADVLSGLDGDEVDVDCVGDGVAAFSDADAVLLAAAIAVGDDGDLPEGLSADADAQIAAITECLDFDLIVDRAMEDDAG